MYFNPSWSHAHSAFVVALFLWYWHETRDARTLGQWILLGAMAGLMLNVYYPNLMLFVILPFEALRDYGAAFRKATPSTPERCATSGPARCFRCDAHTLSAADIYRAPHHLRQHLRNGLRFPQPVELELALSFVRVVFRESRIDFVDADSAFRRDWALCLLAERAARRRGLFAGGHLRFIISSRRIRIGREFLRTETVFLFR